MTYCELRQLLCNYIAFHLRIRNMVLLFRQTQLPQTRNTTSLTLTIIYDGKANAFYYCTVLIVYCSIGFYFYSFIGRRLLYYYVAFMVMKYTNDFMIRPAFTLHWLIFFKEARAAALERRAINLTSRCPSCSFGRH
jgi:hypothetical protein